jgi:predicted phosphodiesterase
MRLTKTLIVPDTHVPYHDKRAFSLVCKIAKTIKVDNIVIIGDFADFLSCSMHDSTSDKRITLKEEMFEVNKAMDRLDDIGAKRKIYVSGNHEFRLERFLAKNAPTLFDSLTVPELLKLKTRNWEYVPYRQHIRLGKISYTHDTGSAGAYAHMRAGAAFEASVVMGHTHRASISYFGNALGETHVCATVGWLGSKEAADYMHAIRVTKDWQLSFGLAYEEPGKNTHIQLVPLVDYRAVVEGKLFA